MLIEVNGLGVNYIIKALAYQEAKLMDQAGEFKKMNQEDLSKSTQHEAEIINALRMKLEKQRSEALLTIVNDEGVDVTSDPVGPLVD